MSNLSQEFTGLLKFLHPVLEPSTGQLVIRPLHKASSTVGGIFNYNRDNWLNDVFMDQARRFQRQNVIMSQACLSSVDKLGSSGGQC